MKFLGIDLGWSSGATGLCCLNWVDGKLHLVDLRCQDAIADILAWIDHWVPAADPGVIGVDAPTLIPNETGMRVPDRLTHRYFGRYHAGCYPANLGRPFADRTVQFGLSLEARGFDHAPTIVPQQSGRYQIEVFPHPAQIHLFGLPRILKYKKGRVAERRAELSRLRCYILEHLPIAEPCLNVTEADLPTIPPQGSTKPVEDQLDSLICAYVAAHWWYWGSDRNQVLGDRQTGYIVIPTPTPISIPG